ncbi:MAG: hypothetical protein AMXMBFR20_06460 [Planctomycetia bacterium]|nr:MAG: hypothetical protein B6D36_14985 [Planctomycetes bacterium UTPLA1]
MTPSSLENHAMKHAVVLTMTVAASLLFAGCATETTTKESADAPRITQVESPQALKNLMAHSDVEVIHSLDHEHFVKGHIPGAVNVDYEKMTESMLPADKDKPLVFYCAGGGCPVSRMAADKAIRWGHRNVSVFEGGIKAWQSAGMTVATGE